MQTTPNQPSSEPPLSHADLVALKQACGPVGLLTFPPIESIRSLKHKGYISIVLGGVQITPLGLERLLRERHRVQTAFAGTDV